MLNELKRLQAMKGHTDADTIAFQEGVRLEQLRIEAILNSPEPVMTQPATIQYAIANSKILNGGRR